MDSLRTITRKVLADGPSGLSDADLLSVLAGRSTASLQSRGNLRRTITMPAAELARHVGRHAGVRIAVAVELGRRTMQKAVDEGTLIGGPKDASAYLIPKYGARPAENFGVILQDAKGRVIRDIIVFTGTVDGTPVHAREVFAEAVASRASTIILFHNHPSGDLVPSADDDVVTARMKAAGIALAIEMVDHIIVSRTAYFSYAEAGRL